MHDVRGVVALAFHDECLRPDHLLDGTQERGYPKYLTPRGVLKPPVIHIRNTIAGIEDDIHVTMLARCFAEPVGKRELGVESRLCQYLHDGVVVVTTDEDVEILRVAVDCGVASEREATSHEVWKTCRVQCFHGTTVEVMRCGFCGRASGHTD